MHHLHIAMKSGEMLAHHNVLNARVCDMDDWSCCGKSTAICDYIPGCAVYHWITGTMEVEWNCSSFIPPRGGQYLAQEDSTFIAYKERRSKTQI